MALSTGPGINISGSWRSSDGWLVQLEQIGNQITATYGRPADGVTGTMSGTFDGSEFTGTYETRDRAGKVIAKGTQTLIQNGNRLEGPWTSSDGRRGSWTLTRG